MSPLKLRQAKDHKQAFDDTVTSINIINDICVIFWEKSTHQIVKSTATAPMPADNAFHTWLINNFEVNCLLVQSRAQPGVNKGTKGQSQYSLT